MVKNTKNTSDDVSLPLIIVNPKSASGSTRDKWSQTASDLRAHFGLGKSAKVDGFTVLWPSGEKEEFPGAAADQFVLLVEGSGVTKPLVAKK